MNYFATILKSLYSHIQNNVPEIKWIDQELGQLDDYETRPALLFPAVLIDFTDATYSEMSTLSQIGEVTITFKLIYAPFSHSSSGTPTPYLDKAIEFYDIEQKLYNAIQGHAIPNYTTPFIRTRVVTERSSPDLRVRNMVFTTSYQDHSAVLTTNKVQAPMLINVVKA